MLLASTANNQQHIKLTKKILTVTQFTGHLILLVEVCTNLVQSDVDALSGYAFGGSSYANVSAET